MTWQWLLQEQQEWHTLTGAGQKAALMEIREILFPSWEGWKSGVLPVLGARTIQREKTANPLELDMIWMSSGTQNEGLRDDITEQPKFELPLRKNLPSLHSPEQNVQGKKKWEEILPKAESCFKHSCLIATLRLCSQRGLALQEGRVNLNQNRPEESGLQVMFHKKQECDILRGKETLTCSWKSQNAPIPRFPGTIPKPVGILTSKRCLCTQQRSRKLNTSVPNWLRLSKRHQSEALTHNEHKDFSLWHRKSFTKCWNNTDLISWLEFLGMLSSGIREANKPKKKKRQKLYSSGENIGNSVPWRREPWCFCCVHIPQQ